MNVCFGNFTSGILWKGPIPKPSKIKPPIGNYFSNGWFKRLNSSENSENWNTKMAPFEHLKYQVPFRHLVVNLGLKMVPFGIKVKIDQHKMVPFEHLKWSPLRRKTPQILNPFWSLVENYYSVDWKWYFEIKLKFVQGKWYSLTLIICSTNDSLKPSPTTHWWDSVCSLSRGSIADIGWEYTVQFTFTHLYSRHGYLSHYRADK